MKRGPRKSVLTVDDDDDDGNSAKAISHGQMLGDVMRFVLFETSRNQVVSLKNIQKHVIKDRVGAAKAGLTRRLMNEATVQFHAIFGYQLVELPVLHDSIGESSAPSASQFSASQPAASQKAPAASQKKKAPLASQKEHEKEKAPASKKPKLSGDFVLRIPSANPPQIEKEMPASKTAWNGLVMVVLSLVLVHGNDSCPEDELQSLVDKLFAENHRAHPLLGEPKEVLKHLVAQEYLARVKTDLDAVQIAEGVKAQWNFMLGPRALLETSRVALYRFTCDLMNMVPSESRIKVFADQDKASLGVQEDD